MHGGKLLLPRMASECSDTFASPNLSRASEEISVGAAFALITYFGFAQTLSINIGAGILENALNSLFGLEQGG